MVNLKNKVAIITGATSGIGEETAKYFAESGARVIVAGRNRTKGVNIENQIIAAGGSAHFVQYDAADESSIINLVNKSIESFGGIDLLFNNAGTFVTGPIEEYDQQKWNQIFNVNMTGIFLLTKYSLPHLIKNRGNILNNASIAGMQSYVNGRAYPYSTSKAAVIQFTKMIALNYGEKIRVNCICPGVIETPIYINRDFSRYFSDIPMKRVGLAIEVAKVAAFLMSDDASYINGVVLPIDGGQSL